MYPFVRSILFRMEPELAHNVTLQALSYFPSAPRLMTPRVPYIKSLDQSLWGMRFPHPIGLAAGLDKNGIAVDGLMECGFSFIEVGTVTPRPQPGNEKPRMFRLRSDQALINRMGFNNRGAAALKRELLHRTRKGIVGVNLGKNKTTPNELAATDYLQSLQTLFPVSDYIVINVSSPNTPGLRDLQNEETLVPLAKSVLLERNRLSETTKASGKYHHPPVLVKLAPDLADEAIQILGQELVSVGIDGFIATNTTVLRNDLQSHFQREQGGLSGKPLGSRSTEVIRLLAQATNRKIPIIGSGGIFSVEDAYQKIRAGAALLQIYTGFIYEGPMLVHRLMRGLAERLRQDGFSSIVEAIGTDLLKIDAR